MTHSVFQLLERCNKYSKDFKKIIHTKTLDEYYVPTRYPNGLPDAIPHKFYVKEDAQKCVNYAKEVVLLVRRQVK